MQNAKDLTTGGAVRLVVYVVGALIGLAALVATVLGYGELSALLATVAAGAAAITGGTATFNLEKAPDQKTPLDVRELLPALLQVASAVKDYRQDDTPEVTAPAPVAPQPDPIPVSTPSTGNPTLDQLRDMIAQNRG